MTALSASVWPSLPMPALILDATDAIADANPAAEIFLNASARSLTGQAADKRLTVAAPLADVIDRVRIGRSPLVLNAVDVTAGGTSPVSCDLHISPVADHPGYVLVLIENRDLAGRIDRAMSSKSAAKSAIGMAEMLAHEIKNPLAGITGAAQLISMSLTPEDQELTDLIVAETRRILKLIDQVEEFGNIRPPARQPVNIHDVLDRARKSAMIGFGAHMRFEEDYDPSLPPAYADPDQLLQVFLNLLKNASEAGKQGGTIRIHSYYDTSLKVRRADGSGAAMPLQVEIIDDGPGIPPEIAAAIFDPFVSGRDNGTGLGLALVAKIVSDHDGLIALDRAPGRTTFRISLPIAPRSTP